MLSLHSTKIQPLKNIIQLLWFSSMLIIICYILRPIREILVRAVLPLSCPTQTGRWRSCCLTQLHAWRQILADCTCNDQHCQLFVSPKTVSLFCMSKDCMRPSSIMWLDHIYIYIYIYIERERERERLDIETDKTQRNTSWLKRYIYIYVAQIRQLLSVTQRADWRQNWF